MKRSALYQRLQKSAFMQKLNSTLLTFHLDCLPPPSPFFSADSTEQHEAKTRTKRKTKKTG